MLEILILLSFFGLVLVTTSRTSIANPFFIYFLIWLLVFLAYYCRQSSFIQVSNYFFSTLVVTKFLAVTILITQQIFFRIDEKNTCATNQIQTREIYINIGQAISIISTPLIYNKALEINGGIDIFSIHGYTLLRHAMAVDELGYGQYSYIMIMTFVITSIRFYQYLETKKKGLLVTSGIMTSLFYVYLSTGRTFVLLLLTLIVFPGIVTKKFKKKSLIQISIAAATLFATITIMTEKGVGIESNTDENIKLITENLISYTIAPILAFSRLFENLNQYDFGINAFRTPIAILNYLGFTELKPIRLVKDYEFIPNPTNVYTVYEVYFRDFSIAGMFIPPLFLIIHFILYKKSVECEGRWIFYYSTSAYPLIMQFFQDQYFSLASMLVQMTFWFTVFIKEVKAQEVNKNHD